MLLQTLCDKPSNFIEKVRLILLLAVSARLADLVFHAFSSLQVCHPQFLYLKECYSSPKIKLLRPIGVREQWNV